MFSPSAIIWKLAGIALLLIALGAQTMRITSLQHDMRNEVFKHQADIDLWRSAGVIAVERAKAKAAAREAAQREVSQEVGNDTQGRLDTLKRALSVFTPSTNPSSASGTSVSGLAYATSVINDPADTSVVSAEDQWRCGSAYIVATGWQIYWHKLTEAAK